MIATCRPAPARTRLRIAAAVLTLVPALAGLSGCAGRAPATAQRRPASGPEATAGPTAYRYDPAIVPPPSAPRASKIAHAVALVRRYVDNAQSGDREPMLAAYAPSVRRSAEVVVARDLELGRDGGALARDVTGFFAVSFDGGALGPPAGARLVEQEDADRLAALLATYPDAYIVAIRFTAAPARSVFVVRDGASWWLLP